MDSCHKASLKKSWIYNCLESAAKHPNSQFNDAVHAVICSTEHTPPFDTDENEVTNIISDFYIKIFAVYSSRLKAHILKNLRCCSSEKIQSLDGHPVICFKYCIDMRHSTETKLHSNESGSSRYKCPQEYHIVLVIEEMDSSGCSKLQSNSLRGYNQNSYLWYHDIDECASLIQTIIKNKLDSEYERMARDTTRDLGRQSMDNTIIKETNSVITEEDTRFETWQSEGVLQHGQPSEQSYFWKWSEPESVEEKFKNWHHSMGEVAEEYDSLEFEAPFYDNDWTPSSSLSMPLEDWKVLASPYENDDSGQKELYSHLRDNNVEAGNDESGSSASHMFDSSEPSHEQNMFSEDEEQEVDVLTDSEPVTVDETAFPQESSTNSNSESEPTSNLEGVIMEMPRFKCTHRILKFVNEYSLRCVPCRQWPDERVEWRSANEKALLAPTAADLLRAHIATVKSKRFKQRTNADDYNNPLSTGDSPDSPTFQTRQLGIVPNVQILEHDSALHATAMLTGLSSKRPEKNNNDEMQQFTTQEKEENCAFQRSTEDSFANFRIRGDLMRRTIGYLYMITKPNTMTHNTESDSADTVDRSNFMQKHKQSIATTNELLNVLYSDDLMGRTYHHLHTQSSKTPSTK